MKSFAKATQEALIKTLKSTKFVLVTKDYTTTNKKLNSIFVTYSDEQYIYIYMHALSLLQLEIDSSGKNIFDLLDKQLKKYGFSW